MTIEHKQYWVNATSDESLEEVWGIPAEKESSIDPATL